METSWTRFLLSGLSKGTLSPGVPSTTSFPNMVPFSLIFLVRQRVSTPGVKKNFYLSLKFYVLSKDCCVFSYTVLLESL